MTREEEILTPTDGMKCFLYYHGLCVSYDRKTALDSKSPMLCRIRERSDCEWFNPEDRAIIEKYGGKKMKGYLETFDEIIDEREDCLHCVEEYGFIQVEGGKVCQKCFDKHGYKKE